MHSQREVLEDQLQVQGLTLVLYILMVYSRVDFFLKP